TYALSFIGPAKILWVSGHVSEHVVMQMALHALFTQEFVSDFIEVIVWLFANGWHYVFGIFREFLVRKHSLDLLQQVPVLPSSENLQRFQSARRKFLRHGHSRDKISLLNAAVELCGANQCRLSGRQGIKK